MNLKETTAIFMQHGGILRMGQALRQGISRTSLYALRDKGIVEELARGLYKLVDNSPLGNPDLVTVALKVPQGVVCLVSALACHELTTQIPHEVYIAIPRNAEPPRLTHPPIRSFRFGGLAYSEGIEVRQMDNVPIRIYCREKTLADCFKYRNKIGLDTVLEALKLYRQQARLDIGALLRYAQICRVSKVMQPYLEAVL